MTKLDIRRFDLRLALLATLALCACDTKDNPAREALTHVRNLTLIIEDNAGNCGATMREFSAYIQQHRQAMNDSIVRSETLDKDEGMRFEEIMEEESSVVFKNFLRSKKSFEGACRKKLPDFPYSEIIVE